MNTEIEKIWKNDELYMTMYLANEQTGSSVKNWSDSMLANFPKIPTNNNPDDVYEHYYTEIQSIGENENFIKARIISNNPPSSIKYSDASKFNLKFRFDKYLPVFDAYFSKELQSSSYYGFVIPITYGYFPLQKDPSDFIIGIQYNTDGSPIQNVYDLYFKCNFNEMIVVADYFKLPYPRDDMCVSEYDYFSIRFVSNIATEMTYYHPKIKWNIFDSYA